MALPGSALILLREPPCSPLPPGAHPSPWARRAVRATPAANRIQRAALGAGCGVRGSRANISPEAGQLTDRWAGQPPSQSWRLVLSTVNMPGASPGPELGSWPQGRLDHLPGVWSKQCRLLCGHMGDSRSSCCLISKPASTYPRPLRAQGLQINITFN